MGKHRWISLIFLTFGVVMLYAETIGIISDDIIRPVNYNTFNPPEKAGATYVDPAFGTKITRMTNTSRFNTFVLGGYFSNSEICFFNKDGSYFLAAENENFDGENLIGTYLYNGHTGERIKLLGQYGTELRPYWIRWALADRYTKNGRYITFDPNTHFYKYESNEIRLYNVRDLENYQVVRKFDEYRKVDIAGGEGDLSHDGRYWVLDGDGKEMFVYDLIDDIKHPTSTFDLGSLGSKGAGVGVDYAAISPKGQYVVVSWGTEPGIGKRRAGIEVYDKRWRFIRQVHPSIVHWTAGVDAFGDEVLYSIVTHDYPQFFSQCGAKPGDLVSVRLSDGHQRLLKSIPSWAHMAFTACNSVTNGDYIYASYHARSEEPEKVWAPFWDEIIEIPTNGSQKVRRFLHHRSHYVPGKSMKYYQPDAVINRQGTKIVYRSTYNHGVGDLYMFDVESRSGEQVDDELSPNVAINFQAGDVTEHTVELMWEQPEKAADGDFPLYYELFRNDQKIADVYDTRYIDEALEESTTYSYILYSYDNSGNKSEQGATVEVTTVTDEIPPELINAQITHRSEIKCHFSEPMDSQSCTNVSNYQLMPDVEIVSAILLDDQLTVQLQTTELASDVKYTLTLNNLADDSKNQNTIAQRTSVTLELLDFFYDDFEDGLNPAWLFKTDDHWSRVQKENNHLLLLNTNDYGDPSTKQVGEYALIMGSEAYGTNFRLECSAASNENLSENSYADYALIFGFQDDGNHYYVQIQSTTTRLHQIKNGDRVLFEEFSHRVKMDVLSTIQLKVMDSKLSVSVDGASVIEYELPETPQGLLGLGSYNDSVYFDNVGAGIIRDNEPPKAPGGLKVSNRE